jgi:hypothetical protein
MNSNNNQNLAATLKKELGDIESNIILIIEKYKESLESVRIGKAFPENEIKKLNDTIKSKARDTHKKIKALYNTGFKDDFQIDLENNLLLLVNKFQQSKEKYNDSISNFKKVDRDKLGCNSKQKISKSKQENNSSDIPINNVINLGVENKEVIICLILDQRFEKRNIRY